MCIVFHQIFYADRIIQFTANLDELNVGSIGKLFHQFIQWMLIIENVANIDNIKVCLPDNQMRT